MKIKSTVALLAAASAMLVAGGCKSISSNRIPSVPVNVNLSSGALWQTYGVSAYGASAEFIKGLKRPASFPYTDRSATGYGGVLLVCGMNPFALEAGVPLAYDLSCPVECKPDVRVAVSPAGGLPEAVCPVCGSRYDIVERGGSPLSGPALADRLGLRRYECLPTQYGGYIITN